MDSGAEPEQIGSTGQSWRKGLGRKDSLRVNQFRLKSMAGLEQNTSLGGWGAHREPAENLKPENGFCHRRKGLGFSSSLSGKEMVCMKPTWQR